VSDDIGVTGAGAALPPVEALRVQTADGLSLEAEYASAGPGERAAVVLAHPHPMQGGSMRSLVTSELFRALPLRGLSVLRFNFRGVEGSEGTHGGGVDEHDDVIAALDAIAAQRPGTGVRGREADARTPLVLAGWSFGADVSLSVIDDRIDGWFLIAPPLRVLRDDAFVAAHDPRPKCFVVPERDQFCPPSALRQRTAGWSNVDVNEVPGADHFLVGRTRAAVDLLVGFVERLSLD
jgi:alpha/beta superfamily hydrolase